MRYNTKKLREIQRIISRSIDLKDRFENIKAIAGFDVAIHKDTLVCACIVVSYPDMRILEKKFLVKKQPMPYVPTFMAFREGPLILELYHELEYDPDLLMIDGHGIAHVFKCGLASYVGHELSKPSIGIGKGMPQGSSIYEEDKVVVNNEIRGFLLKTKEHARPLIVSPGHMITRESALEFAKNTVIPPHKLPEPVHLAHRYAEKKKKQLFVEKKEIEDNDSEPEDLPAMRSFD